MSDKKRVANGERVRWRFRKTGPEHEGLILAFVPQRYSMRDAAMQAGRRDFYAEDRSGWDRYLVRLVGDSSLYAVAAGTIHRANPTAKREP